MPELRKDPIVDRWVIIAKERAARPQEFVVAPSENGGSADGCPFCEGREAQTPGELLAFRDDREIGPDGPGWRVRVVPNKFPAVRHVRDVEGDQAAVRQESLFECSLAGIGAHEVIVETPDHRTLIGQLSPLELGEVLRAYRERIAELRLDPRLAAVIPFKNLGAAAGASLQHLHSQLIATPIIPTTLLAELEGAHRHAKATGRCIFCDLISRERQARVRVVAESDHHFALCPYASRVPGETWVLPKTHAPHFDEQPPEHSADLASLLHAVLSAIEASLDTAAYNYVIHTAPFHEPPFDKTAVSGYHWHIEILPSVTRQAGFEAGSGLLINPVPPEDAAVMLRSAIAG